MTSGRKPWRQEMSGLSISAAASAPPVRRQPLAWEWRHGYRHAGMSDPLLGFANDGLRFEALIGRGGMGAVYRGQQIALGRTVAIKVVAAHLLSDPRVVERFRREASVLSRLSHPHVVGCFDVAEIAGPDGRLLHVMVLEYIDGLSLGQRLASGFAQPVDVRQAFTWLSQIAIGLDAAHRQGVVHRDVKPDNMLVGRDGRARLGDFGLARDPSALQVTQTGAIMGSPAYLAPEICRGGEPTASADIYALGISLFQVATGDLPFCAANPVRLLHLHSHEPPPRLAFRKPELAALEPLVQRCLAKLARERPTAAAVASELQRLIPDLALLPTVPLRADPHAATSRSHRAGNAQPPEHAGWQRWRARVAPLAGSRLGVIAGITALVVAGVLLIRPWLMVSSTVEPSQNPDRELRERLEADLSLLEIAADTDPEVSEQHLVVLRRIVPVAWRGRVVQISQRVEAARQRVWQQRLDDAERALIDNQRSVAGARLALAPSASSALLCARWTALRQRLARSQQIPPGASAAVIVALRQGLTGTPHNNYPAFRPLAVDEPRCSDESAGSDLRLRLPTLSAAFGIAVIMHGGASGRTVRFAGRTATGAWQQDIAISAGWSVATLPVAEWRDTIVMRADGSSPLWCAAAGCASDRAPSFLELAAPGSLRPLLRSSSMEPLRSSNMEPLRSSNMEPARSSSLESMRSSLESARSSPLNWASALLHVPSDCRDDLALELAWAIGQGLGLNRAVTVIHGPREDATGADALTFSYGLAPPAGRATVHIITTTAAAPSASSAWAVIDLPAALAPFTQIRGAGGEVSDLIPAAVQAGVAELKARCEAVVP